MTPGSLQYRQDMGLGVGNQVGTLPLTPNAGCPACNQMAAELRLLRHQIANLQQIVEFANLATNKKG